MNKKKNIVVFWLLSLPLLFFTLAGVFVGIISILEEARFYYLFLQGGVLTYLYQSGSLHTLVIYMVQWLCAVALRIPLRIPERIRKGLNLLIPVSALLWLTYDLSASRLILINLAVAALFLFADKISGMKRREYNKPAGLSQ